MKRTRSVIVAIAVLAGMLSLSGCFGFTPVDVVGRWTGSIAWTSGPASGFTKPLSLTLAQEETQITGEIGLMGPGSKPFSIPITEGTAGNGTFTIRAAGVMNVISPPVSVQIDLEGSRERDVLSGTGTQTNDGSPYNFNWSATLQAAAE